jgi:hypothetical protein
VLPRNVFGERPSSDAMAGRSGSTKTAYNADNEQTKFNGTSFTFDAGGNLTGDGTYTYV